MAGDKTRCSGKWTEARFQNFIKGSLRRASMHWAPISECLRLARVGRGEYKCASCGQTVPATTKDEATGKRVKNIHVDHIDPVIDPAVGFTTWDEVINRLFVELDGLQAICHACHKIKTDEEKAVAKDRRSNAE